MDEKLQAGGKLSKQRRVELYHKCFAEMLKLLSFQYNKIIFAV